MGDSKKAGWVVVEEELMVGLEGMRRMVLVAVGAGSRIHKVLGCVGENRGLKQGMGVTARALGV